MITSVRNPRIAEVRRLKKSRERKATGKTTIDGPVLLQEAVDHGVDVLEIFSLPDDSATAEIADAAGIAVIEVSSEVIDALGSSIHPRGPVAVIEIPPMGEISATDSVVLWELADPGNAGTIIRTAAAFGFQVVASSGTCDLWSPKVIRAAAGAHFRTRLVTGLQEIEELERAGLVPLAMSAQGVAISKIDMADPGPIAFMVGNEAHGLPAAFRDRATAVALPMLGGTESLNAGVAAGIAMYLRMSRRRDTE
jgi:TrmH family RNA methyltransferase